MQAAAVHPPQLLRIWTVATLAVAPRFLIFEFVSLFFARVLIVWALEQNAPTGSLVVPVHPISSASWKRISWRTNKAAKAASPRGHPPGGGSSVSPPYTAIATSVAATGTPNRVIRYQRPGTRYLSVRRARSVAPDHPSAPVTTNAARPTPRMVPTAPNSGRSNGRTFDATTGGVSAAAR